MDFDIFLDVYSACSFHDNLLSIMENFLESSNF
jgi:hypothetical protein